MSKVNVQMLEPQTNGIRTIDTTTKHKKDRINFSKEIFIECIEGLKSQRDHDKKCSDAFQIILPSDFISFYDNSFVQNKLIKVMQVAMNDDHRDSWIDYYIYELDFGKGYSFGCATNKDGSNIDLSTPATLWEYLNSIEN